MKIQNYRFVILLISILLSFIAVAKADVPISVDASTFGYDPVDATYALQAAIDSGAQRVYVPNMGTPWNIQSVFLNSSNQSIIFEDGVLVKAKGEAFYDPRQSLFTCRGESNITITGYGATIQMRKEDYVPYGGEWRHGISLLGCNNINILGMKIADTGGDGIYVGSDNGTPCRGVTIKNVTLENNYRQGISVISVENLLVENNIIRTTSGTPPSAGIDFEPNNQDDVLVNCIVRNNVIDGNYGDGIQLYLPLMDSPWINATGIIENNTIINSGTDGITTSHHLQNWVFKDNLIVGNNGYGMKQDWVGSQTDVSYTAFWGNTSGATYSFDEGPGIVKTAEPIFVSTDINDPSYMYLAKNNPSQILTGASNGGYIGARPSVQADRPEVHYIFNEKSPGEWEVLVEVVGEGTAGLSGYEIWVDNVDPGLVSFEENVLSTVVGENYTPVGFSPSTFLQGDVGGSFNAGNFQNSGDAAFQGVGIMPIYEEGSIPGTTPLVDLGVPALLGILYSDVDLRSGDFRAITAGLLDESGNGFFTDPPIVSIIVNELEQQSFLFGDADRDGVVSAADYICIQTHFGNSGDPGILGDANRDGVVSAADYACVQANFGQILSSTIDNNMSVPEPATLFVLSTGLFSIVGKRKPGRIYNEKK